MVKGKVVQHEIADGTETKKTKSKKLAHSSFHITINPNVRTIKGTDKYTEHHKHLKEFYQRLFAEDNIVSWIQFNRPNEGESFVKDVEIQPVMEYGESNKCLHLHVLVHISHYTNLSLNVTSLGQQVRSEFPGAHLNCDFVRDYKNLTLDYIRKNINVDS